MERRFKNIIFDLDGTLIDSRLGIYNSMVNALKMLNIKEIPKVLPMEFIGPPLQQGFKNVFHLNEKETTLAVSYFRDYYGRKGLFEIIPYEGIAELLEELSLQGKKLFLATSKLEKYAWEIIRYLEFDKYITDICGADYSGNHTKSGLIGLIIDKYRLLKEETIMVGDTLYDIEGAREAGIRCIAVEYGFNARDTLITANPDFYADDVEGLGGLIFKNIL